MQSNTLNGNLHVDNVTGSALVSWKSIFAGLLVSLFVYMTLMALGTAIGASTVSGALDESRSVSGVAMGGGIWLLVTAFISLAAGSYFASRISHYATKRIGAFQGAIIASLFFGLLIYSATSTLGAIGGQLGSLASNMSGGAASLASNPQVQGMIERSIGGELNLKSEPQVVAQGLATRMLSGNDDAAKNYLAYQTGRSPAEIEQRYVQMKAELTAKAEQVGSEVAAGISTAGWVLFGTMALGMVFAVLAGTWGAAVNYRKPLTEGTGSTYSNMPHPQPM